MVKAGNFWFSLEAVKCAHVEDGKYLSVSFGGDCVMRLSLQKEDGTGRQVMALLDAAAARDAAVGPEVAPLDYKPKEMTGLDVIRGLSAEELVKLLLDDVECCPPPMQHRACNDATRCRDCWMQYLESPLAGKEGEHENPR